MQAFIILAALWVATNASSLLLMEQLNRVPESWHQVGVPVASNRINLRIAMKQPNETLFEQALLHISSPDHPRYGQHMTREELKDMLRPSRKATEAVTQWLDNAGITDVEDDGEWINFVTTAAQVEELLQTEFAIYRHEPQNIERIRTLHYSVPENLHQYIDMIQPTTRFGHFQPKMKHVPDVHRMDEAESKLMAEATTLVPFITPQRLKQLYNVQDFQLKDNETAGFAAFTNFIEQYPRYSDLTAFEAKYAPYATGRNFTWTSIAGGKLDQSSTKDSFEANLDVQYLLSVGHPVPVHAYSISGGIPSISNPNQPNSDDYSFQPYLDLLIYLLKQPNEELPHTLTTSYGEPEQLVPLQYRKTMCNMFGQLGARGVSVLSASGDFGPGSSCLTNDGKYTRRFLPVFPASCPYVTSVGGTFRVQPEEAIYFSSGGFSDTWPRPSWQNEAVRTYLDILGPDRWRGFYNPDGRGFPDVAAQAYPYLIKDKGEEIRIWGTSASAPTFAGIVALLNAAMIQAGKSPLGFLNPFLYSKGYKGLTDIVTGGSRGCAMTNLYTGLLIATVPYASWNATPG